jgi:tetratricopeptide (TPR) repeat protein
MFRVIAALAALSVIAAPAQQEINEAIQALEKEDYPRAAELLEKVVAAEPKNISARFNLALAYAQLEQDEKAIAEYKAVLEQKPDLPQAQVNLGILLLRQQRPAEAAPLLKPIAESQPEDARIQLYYARALHKSGQLDAAVVPYERAIALDPSSADAMLGLAESLAKLERYDEAEAYYRKAAAIDPELFQMLLQLAEYLEGKGRGGQALKLYQEYLAKVPGNAAVAERVAMMLMEQKRYSEAAPILEQVVKASPTTASLTALAEVYALEGDTPRALPLWKAALELEPSNADLNFRYANGLLHAAEAEQAAQHYYVAVKAKSDFAEAWNGLAFALYKLENLPGSLKALDQVRGTGAEKPAAVYLRAIIEDKLQLHVVAKADYERFLAMKSGLEDEEFKSRQRIIVITKVLERK